MGHMGRTNTTITAADGAGELFLGSAVIIIVTVSAIVLLALFIAALVSILRSDHLTGGGKLVWVVITWFLPFIGPIIWFLFGRTTPLSKGPSPPRSASGH